MFLKTLAVSNFKPFEHAELALQPTGITLLLGQNNSGKTALLSALDVLNGNFTAPYRRTGATHPAGIFATFGLSDDDRRLCFKGAPDPSAWLKTSAFTEVTFVFSDSYGPMVATSVEATLPWGNERARIAVYDFPNQSVEVASLPNFFKQAPSRVEPELRSTGVRGGTQDPGRLFRDVPSPISQLFSDWQRRAFHFRALRRGTERKVELRSMPDLDPGGSNLPQVLIHLKNREPDAYGRIRTIIGALVPDVGHLETPTDQTELALTFTDPFSKEQRNLKDLGTGVEQLLLTVTAGTRRRAGDLLVIEELESNLHAGAIRRLAQHLREWASDSQILLSSHSTVFVDEAGGDAKVWLIERANGASKLTAIDENVATALTSLGVRMSDVLSSERILILEGRTDVAPLKTWFPLLRTRSLVAVVPAGGGDRASHVETVKTVIEAADRLERRVLFLRDRDELSEAQLERLQAPWIRILDRRELENYLLDDVEAIRAHLQELMGKGLPPSIAELAKSIRAAAEDTKPIVILKRVAAEFPPIRMWSRNDMKALPALTLEAFVQVVTANSKKAIELLNEVEPIWKRVTAATNDSWERGWRALAPGEEVLSTVWGKIGLNYKKERDTIGIARRMKPPSELVTIIEDFLSEAPSSTRR